MIQAVIAAENESRGNENRKSVVTARQGDNDREYMISPEAQLSSNLTDFGGRVGSWESSK